MAADASRSTPESGDARCRRFEALQHEFADRLAGIAAHVDERLVRGDWERRNEALALDLLPVPPADFLRHPAILFQMFVDARHLASELPYVLDRLPAPQLAEEDPIGGPPTTPIGAEGVTTSSNTVHHLHHLLRYEDATGTALADVATVVEWGGGYGNLAKLFLRLHGGAPTYVLIDTPVFAAVQWLYLSSIVGGEQVRLHDRPGTAVVEGAINVVPVGLAATLDVDADLFVSTWALNESAPAAQQLVVDRSWFGAGSLLLGMHQGDPFEPVALAHGARSLPVTASMPGQRYFIH